MMYGVAWQYYERPAALISVRQGHCELNHQKVPRSQRSQVPYSTFSTSHFLLPTSHSHLCTQTLFSLVLHSVVHGAGRTDTALTELCLSAFSSRCFPPSQAFNQIACLQSELFLHSAGLLDYWTTGLLELSPHTIVELARPLSSYIISHWIASQINPYPL